MADRWAKGVGRDALTLVTVPRPGAAPAACSGSASPRSSASTPPAATSTCAPTPRSGWPPPRCCCGSTARCSSDDGTLPRSYDKYVKHILAKRGLVAAPGRRAPARARRGLGRSSAGASRSTGCAATGTASSATSPSCMPQPVPGVHADEVDPRGPARRRRRRPRPPGRAPGAETERKRRRAIAPGGRARPTAGARKAAAAASVTVRSARHTRPASRPRADLAPGELPAVAVITMARDEGTMLRRWVDHYAAQVGAEHVARHRRQQPATGPPTTCRARSSRSRYLRKQRVRAGADGPARRASRPGCSRPTTPCCSATPTSSSSPTPTGTRACATSSPPGRGRDGGRRARAQRRPRPAARGAAARRRADPRPAAAREVPAADVQAGAEVGARRVGARLARDPLPLRGRPRPVHVPHQVRRPRPPRRGRRQAAPAHQTEGRAAKTSWARPRRRDGRAARRASRGRRHDRDAIEAVRAARREARAASCSSGPDVARDRPGTGDRRCASARSCGSRTGSSGWCDVSTLTASTADGLGRRPTRRRVWDVTSRRPPRLVVPARRLRRDRAPSAGRVAWPRDLVKLPRGRRRPGRARRRHDAVRRAGAVRRVRDRGRPRRPGRRPARVDRTAGSCARSRPARPSQLEPLMDALETVIVRWAGGVHGVPGLRHPARARCARATCIGHDNDVDVGYVSVHTEPVDVVRESFRSSASCTGAGSRLSRYSGGAFKVTVDDRRATARTDRARRLRRLLPRGHLVLMGEILDPFEEAWMLPARHGRAGGSHVPRAGAARAPARGDVRPGWRVPDPRSRYRTSARRPPPPRRLVPWHPHLPQQLGPPLLHLGPARPLEPGAPRARAAPAPARGGARHVGRRRRVRPRPGRRLAGQPRPPRHRARLLRQRLCAPRAACPGRGLGRDVPRGQPAGDALGAAVRARAALEPGPRAMLGRHVLDATTERGRQGVWRMTRTVLGDGGRLYLDFMASGTPDAPVDYADALVGDLDPGPGRRGRRGRRSGPGARFRGVEGAELPSTPVPGSPRPRVCRMVVEWGA